MKSRHEQKIKDGAKPLLEDGEEIISAFVARPRGWTQASAGHAGPGQIAANVGRAKQSQAYAAGERTEFRLASPMALAITQRRLLVLSIGSPIGLGIGGDIKELVSAVPLSEIDSIEIKRLAVGKVVTVTVRGEPIKLEAGALADAKGLVEAFDRSKAAV
jgi:hypothetical protein